MSAKLLVLSAIVLSLSLVGCKKEEAQPDTAEKPAAAKPASAAASEPAAAPAPEPAAAAGGDAKATKEDCEKAFKNQAAIEPDATMKKSMEQAVPQQVEGCAGMMSKAITDCMTATTDPTKIGECALR